MREFVDLQKEMRPPASDPDRNVLSPKIAKIMLTE